MEEMLPKEKAGSCLACSDFPVSHLSTFIFASFDARMNDVLHARSENFLGRAVQYLTRTAAFFAPPLLQFLHIVSGSVTNTKPEFALTNRAQVVWQEALRRGITMEQVVLFGMATDCYRARIRDRWIYFQSLPIPPHREFRSYPWIDDKLLFKQLLEHHGIPAAQAATATHLDDAQTKFMQLQKPVVVKPRIGSRARHTTPNVWTLEDFERAFLSARELCRDVLFEEHLSGDLCRATVVDGTLSGFLRKKQPQITGDGVHTIRQLVAEKNADKPERVWEIVWGPEHDAYVGRQGYMPDSVLENNRTIDISRHSGRQVGGETREMPDEIHPALRAAIEQAARLLQTPLVGFDLIIPDPAMDPTNQRWGILEANALPFIELHYNPLYGESSNVAGAIWDLWFEKENPASAGLSRKFV